jgi:uncharacterized iron-regulated protein
MVYRIISIIVVVLLPISVGALPSGGIVLPENALEVSIDVEKEKIAGVSRITVKPGKELLLRKGRLAIHYVKHNGKPIPYLEQDSTLKIVSEEEGSVEIAFEGRFHGAIRSRTSDEKIVDNVIDKKGVMLTGTWYPVIDGLSYHRLRVTLPPGYEAVSEAEEVRKSTGDEGIEFFFDFPHPLDSINLVASNRFEIIEDRLGDTAIYAYFFPEEMHLAQSYIEFTKKYLALYEELIGDYPYKRFSIVENILPTGYAMPTFTLIGSSVVKLPFIVETSLGHEVLHQWFGNLVYIDYENGNWAEGLTTYLADHLYKEQEGKGWEYRKQMLISYASYVKAEYEFPLRDFTARFDPASRAIGYNKTAMVFHMLRNMAGDDDFFRALRDFIEQNRFRAASWNDIQASFENIYNKGLSWFFKQWVDEKGLPDITLEDTEVTYLDGNFSLHFHIKQNGPVYRMDVPITIYTNGRPIKRFFTIDREDKAFDVFLSDSPEIIVLDEDYDVARRLLNDELPPVISRLLGQKTFLLALPQERKRMYSVIIDKFKKEGATLKKAGDIRDSDIMSSSVVVLGIESPLVKRLYGSLPVPDAGFTVMIKENPWDPQNVVAIMHGRSQDEVEAAFKKISHYGKYSYLTFQEGRNTKKSTSETLRGIRMVLKEEAPAMEIASVKKLTGIIENVADKRIIYVGEFHDVFAHHAVQFDIIKGIYNTQKNISIGMEMFQRPFQRTLDDFIIGKINEKEFLKKSEYFKRWGFDYNLYKPILDFARSRSIPVIALNIDREIIRKVSEGGIDSLARKEQKAIPHDMDFSDMRYKERLRETFRLHKNAEKKNFNYFYQSQILWDETMSRSIDEFLKDNPDSRMVVLAGQGHLEYGSGIPQRTYRRNGYDYAVILIDADVERGIADYVIFPKPVEGITAPKLMVFLKPEDGRFEVTGFPHESVSKKAGLQAGDVILALDDVEVNSIGDIKIHLLYKKKGGKIKVKVVRKVKDKRKYLELEVKL